MYVMTVEYFEPADPAGFDRAYRERHVPLVQAVPGVERFTLTNPRGGDGTPHLVAQLWFAGREAFKAAQATPEMAATGADAETYDVARKQIFVGEIEDLL